MTRIISILLTMLFITVGCSDDQSQQKIASSPPARFISESSHSKVYFYASYVNPDTRPYFDEVFRLHIDGGYIQDISADQYLVKDLPLGDHLFEVDEISWTGYVTNHSAVIVRVDNKTPHYVADDILPKDKAVFSSVPIERGEKDITSRTQTCPCEYSLLR